MKKNQALEKVIHGIFLLLGLITVGCVLLITVYLVISGIPAIREIGLVDFLFGKEWASTASQPKYGILPFILTSVYGTAGAIMIGVPVGFMTAVYLSKLASPKVKSVMQSVLPHPSTYFQFHVCDILSIPQNPRFQDTLYSQKLRTLR